MTGVYHEVLFGYVISHFCEADINFSEVCLGESKFMKSSRNANMSNVMDFKLPVDRKDKFFIRPSQKTSGIRCWLQLGTFIIKRH